MRRISHLTAIVLISMLAPVGYAQQQTPRRPSAPMLTNDDVLSPRAVRPQPDEAAVATDVARTPLRNARAVLENTLGKMSEVNSMRTRVQTSLPTGQAEMVIESIKPDRTRVISPYGEIITIGRRFYKKSAAGWQMTSMPAGGAQSDTSFDFRSFLKLMLGKSNVRVTGHLLGAQTIDGVETTAYEFSITDGSETGTIQACVGKDDGYLRQLFLSGGAVDLKLWFTNINESMSIEPPM